MDWMTLSAIVSAAANSLYTLLFSLIVIFAYVEIKELGKNKRLQGALTIFGELYTDVARKARKKVYKEVSAEIEGIEDEKLESYLEIVQDACFPYQRIGYLISEGHIDSNPIITTHWQSVWRCWKKTENLIKWARVKRGEPTYFKHFKHLFDLSEAYRI